MATGRALKYICEQCSASNTEFLWRDAHDFHGSDGLLCTACALKSGRTPAIMTFRKYKCNIGYREPMDRAIFVDSVMHDRKYDEDVDRKFTDHLIEELKKPEYASIKASFY